MFWLDKCGCMKIPSWPDYWTKKKAQKEKENKMRSAVVFKMGGSTVVMQHQNNHQNGPNTDNSCSTDNFCNTDNLDDNHNGEKSQTYVTEKGGTYMVQNKDSWHQHIGTVNPKVQTFMVQGRQTEVSLPQTVTCKHTGMSYDIYVCFTQYKCSFDLK